MKLMASLARRHMYKLKAPGGRVAKKQDTGNRWWMAPSLLLT